MQTFTFWQAFEGAATVVQTTCIRTAGLCRVLISPVSTHEDSRRREYILNIVLVLSLGLLVVFEGIILFNRYIIFGASYAGLQPGTFLMHILIAASLFVTSKKGYALPASYILIVCFGAGALYAGWRWGVSLPATLLLIALVIVTSSILISSRFGFTAAVLMIISLGILGVHEATALNVPDWRYEEITTTDVVAYTAIFLFISFITWLSNNEIKRSLIRARMSEQLLAIERDQLEQRVAARTEEFLRSERVRMQELAHITEFGQLSRGLFHDLMSPLSAITMSLRKLKTGTTNVQDIRETEEAANRALEASRRMEAYMKSVKRCLGAAGLADEVADLGEEIEIVRDVLAYSARMANVTITSGPPVEAYIRLHPMRLHQLLLNLVSNGIDACTAAGNDTERKVTICCSPAQDGLIVEVSDTGSGITEDRLGRLFKESFTSKPDGTGVGLTTVRVIVEQELHGTIGVSSEIGKGSRFIITIPRQAILNRAGTHDSADTSKDQGYPSEPECSDSGV